ncbi:MAG: HAD family hydrolase [Candidatus Kariarchaeaceae archaeon]
MTNLNSENWIFFDWGDTLVDTFTANYHAFKNFFSLDVSDFRVIKKEQVKQFLIDAPKIGRNAALTKNMLGTVRYFSEKKTWDNLILGAYFKYSKKFEGIDDLLSIVKTKKYKIAIVSINYIFAKLHKLTKEYIQSVQLEMTSFDTILAHKDNKIKLVHKFLIENPKARISAIVGDTQTDVELAKYFNVPSIFVTWGCAAIDDLKINPNYIANDINELKQILTNKV